MQKIIFSLAVVLVTGLLLFACSKGYESRKNIDDLNITLSVDRYPLVKGDNTLSAQLTDAARKPVTDASVTVRYFMPSMPGMAPMDFNTQAVLNGDRYSFSANIPMEGGWKTELNIARPGKQAAVATFNLDAR